MLKLIVRYHNHLLASGAAWSEENPVGGLHRAAMPWLLTMLGLSIIGIIFDPANVTQLTILLIGWLPSVLGLFYAISTFAVGAGTAFRARRAEKANDG